MLPLTPALSLTPKQKVPPVKITQAEPSGNPWASQSLSVLQTRQLSSCEMPWPDAQKLALPVVSTQSPLVPQLADIWPATQKSRSGVQAPVSWAAHLDLSFFLFFGRFPLQMPEQHLLFLPLHFLPTSRQPNSFFLGLLRFFFLPVATGANLSKGATLVLRSSAATCRRESAAASRRARRSMSWLSKMRSPVAIQNRGASVRNAARADDVGAVS